MKRKYSILATALLFSIGGFAQKDEFKTLKKIYEKDSYSLKDVTQYKAAVVAATPLVSASNEEDMLYLNFYKAGIPVIEMSEAMAKPENQANPEKALKFFTPNVISDIAKSTTALMNYEKKSGKAVLTKSIEDDIVKMKPLLLSYAVNLAKEEKFSEASQVLYSIYQLNPTDPEKLYYAASYSINANDYKLALDYYMLLKDLNYSGEKTNYIAVSKANDVAQYFNSKEERNQAVKIGTHATPTEVLEPSKRGEIYKNIALILVSQGKTDEAKSAIIEARKVNPDDISLIVSEADLYLKMNDKVTYAKLIKEVLEKDPTNADLFYNLGVISSQNKDNINAENYYLKAIQLNPALANAYYNLSAIKIDQAQVIFDQMNKLGTSAADNKKYDALKIKRDQSLKQIVELLEKTISLDTKNSEAKTVLVTVYKALEMKEKAKALDMTIDK